MVIAITLAFPYKTTLSALWPVVKEANVYYFESDYKDYNFAKANEWHPILLKKFNDFSMADRIMRKELSIISDLRNKEYL